MAISMPASWLILVLRQLDLPLGDGLTSLLAAFQPVLIMLLSTAFLYAALGRSKLFHEQPGSRLIVSFVLGIFSATVIQAEHWSTIVAVAGSAVAGGIISLLVWSVVLHRGKLKHEVNKNGEGKGNG